MLIPFVEQLCDAPLVGRFVRVLGPRIAGFSYVDSKGRGAGCSRRYKPTSIDAHELLPEKTFEVVELSKVDSNLAMLPNDGNFGTQKKVDLG